MLSQNEPARAQDSTPASLDRVAVIGPHAAEVLLDGYAGRPRHTVSILDGLRKPLEGLAEVSNAEGVRITEDSAFTDEPLPHMSGERSHSSWVTDRVFPANPEDNVSRIHEAVTLASDSDVAVLVVGDNEMTSREAWAESHLGDRPNIDLRGQPHFYNQKPSARRGYLFESAERLFLFGFGLSYTTFAYGEPRIEPAQMGPHGKTTVSVDVTNTGDRAGDEVVQLDIRDHVSHATRPVKELKGFERITLATGDTQTVTFTLGPGELSYHRLDMQRVAEPGTFDIMVGPNSATPKSTPT